MRDRPATAGLSPAARAQLARALTVVERGGEAADELLAALQPADSAYRIGVTGAPGVGKSTLTAGIVRAGRATGKQIAVIAVDPSSPFSGGALLGDRVRMADVAGDTGVYLRSVAARGALGGLCGAAADSVDVLDAAGFDWIVIETVGVGQSEVDVMRLVDTVLVVVAPDAGDEVQVAKAGILETADVFVLNKDDRPGSDAVGSALQRIIHSTPPPARWNGWHPPIVRTVASDGRGIAMLMAALADHRRFLEHDSRLASRRALQRRRRLRDLILAAIESELDSPTWQAQCDRALADAAATSTPLRAVAAALLAELRRAEPARHGAGEP